MDKATKSKFIEIDKEIDETIDKRLQTEIERRKEEHYKTLQND